jgi:hypothetical protein
MARPRSGYDGAMEDGALSPQERAALDVIEIQLVEDDPVFVEQFIVGARSLGRSGTTPTDGLPRRHRRRHGER